MSDPIFLGINVNCELVFFDRWNTYLGGACGILMDASITKDVIEERNSPDYVASEFRYLWVEAAKDGTTDKGLTEYIEDLIQDTISGSDSLFLGDDPSYRFATENVIDNLPDEMRKRVEEIVGVRGENYEALSCTSCGALFSDAKSLDTSDWLLVANPEKIAEILDNIKNFHK